MERINRVTSLVQAIFDIDGDEHVSTKELSREQLEYFLSRPVEKHGVSTRELARHLLARADLYERSVAKTIADGLFSRMGSGPMLSGTVQAHAAKQLGLRVRDCHLDYSTFTRGAQAYLDNKFPSAPRFESSGPVPDNTSIANYREITVKHVDLTLDIDVDDGVVFGEAEYTIGSMTQVSGATVMHSTGPLYLRNPDLVLDIQNMTIRSAHALNDRGQSMELPVSTGTTRSGEGMSVPVPVGAQKIVVRYELHGTDTGWDGETRAFTHAGKPARALLPMQDTPAVTMTYSGHVRVQGDGQYQVIAPGAVSMDAGAEHSENTWSFAVDTPMPAHLLGVTVGSLQMKPLGPRVRVYANDKVLASALHNVSDVEALIQHAERMFGPLPTPTLDLVVSSHEAGGHAHGQLVVSERDMQSPEQTQRAVLQGIAHAWFGQSVRYKQMQDAWITAGFAAWAGRTLIEERLGHAAAQQEWADGAERMRELMEHPLFGSSTCLTEAYTQRANAEQRAMIVEEKGALFVRALEQRVGRKSFLRFVQQMTHDFRGRAISTDGLHRYIMDAPLLRGAMNRAELSAWINGPGIPE